MTENKCNAFKAVQLWFTENTQYLANVRHYLLPMLDIGYIII